LLVIKNQSSALLPTRTSCETSEMIDDLASVNAPLRPPPPVPSRSETRFWYVASVRFHSAKMALRATRFGSRS